MYQKREYRYDTKWQSIKIGYKKIIEKYKTLIQKYIQKMKITIHIINNVCDKGEAIDTKIYTQVQERFIV